MEKIVIITGGSKGLGYGLVNEYLKNGYRVISISRSINEKLINVEQYQCDLSKSSTIEKILTKIFSPLNPQNITNLTLINNAGYLGTINTLENLTPADISYTIQLNLIAPLVLNSLFIKLSKDWNCKKQLFNISSGAAKTPYESWSIYCASKAGIDMMTKVISKEQEDLNNGVSIVSIYPGVVDTNMQTEIRNTPKENFKSIQRFIDLYKQGDLLTPKEVAEKIYRLDNSGELKNGQILDIRNV